MDTETLTKRRALLYGLRYLAREKLQTDPRLLPLLPLTKVKEYGVFPVARYGDLLVVAFALPDELQVKELALITNCRIAPALSTARAIGEAITKSYGVSLYELPKWERDATSLLSPARS